MAGSKKWPDLFMDGSVTRTLDIQLPDEIIAIMGRELKIDYLSKRHCIMVSKKSDSFFSGKGTECTSKNILRIPDEIKNKLKLKSDESVVCSYDTVSGCLIIKKKAGSNAGDKPHMIKERKKVTNRTVENSLPTQTKSVCQKSDVFVGSPSYPYQYKPEAFANYRPPNKKTNELAFHDAMELCGYVRDVMEADGETALFLIWRFAFGIDCNVIRYFSKTSKSVNGICEAFRFGCKRFLEREDDISDASLERVFRTALSDYDIILLHKQRGISWMSRNSFESDISITELARCFQQKMFISLEDAAQSPGSYAALDDGKIEKLSKYILNLPVEYGSLLLLRYYRRYEVSEIENMLDVSYVKGKIEYLRRALSDRMGLAGKLISDGSFSKACASCVSLLHIL